MCVCVCVLVLQVAELEAQLGPPAAAGETGEELSQSVEELQTLLRAKDQVRLRRLQNQHLHTRRSEDHSTWYRYIWREQLISIATNSL